MLYVRYTGSRREVDELFALTGLLAGDTYEEREYLSRVCRQDSF